MKRQEGTIRKSIKRESRIVKKNRKRAKELNRKFKDIDEQKDIIAEKHSFKLNDKIN